MVRAGEEVLITDHGEVVAEFKRPGKWPAEDLVAGLMQMIRAGRFSASAKTDSKLCLPTKRLLPAGLAAKLLSKERENR